MADRRNKYDGTRAVTPIIQRANATKVLVKSPAGKAKKLASVEFLIEQTFVEAINGDVGAHKDVLRWAKEYMLPPRSKLISQSTTREITQADVDLWKAAGALPSGCPDILERMSLAMLNKAYRAYKKSIPESLNQKRALGVLRRSFAKLRRALAESSQNSSGDHSC